MPPVRLASTIAALLFLAVPALAEEHPVPAAHDGGHADVAAAPADHTECDATAMARDEMRRATNPIVAVVMVPRPGCPAFADLSAPVGDHETEETHAAEAAAPSSGH